MQLKRYNVKTGITMQNITTAWLSKKKMILSFPDWTVDN
jgi:hypothetical protein